MGRTPSGGRWSSGGGRSGAEVLRGLVVVAAGVLVVALAHLVRHVAEGVLRIDVAHEALLLAARWAGGLLLPPPRQLPGVSSW